MCVCLRVCVCMLAYVSVHMLSVSIYMHIYILISREELSYTLAPGDTPASVAYQQVRCNSN